MKKIFILFSILATISFAETFYPQTTKFLNEIKLIKINTSSNFTFTSTSNGVYNFDTINRPTWQGNELAIMDDLPDSQIQSDWNQDDDTKVNYIKHKPTILTEDDVYNIISNLVVNGGLVIDSVSYKLVVDEYSPPPRAETVFTLDDGTEQTYDIVGTLDRQWMIDNGLYNSSWLVAITSANIGTNVTSIGYQAFSGCTSMTNVTIGNGVTNIEQYAFSGCSGLTSLTILGNVLNDWSYETPPFANCTNLETIVLGEKMTKIGNKMFSGCSGLTNITIPDGVTSIGASAFSGCSRLASINIPASVKSIGDSAFSGCDSLYDTNSIPGVILVDGWAVGSQSPSGDLDLTEIRGIGAMVFSGCSGLTNVAIPDTTFSIEYRTFSGCSGLTNVAIPNSVTSIGYAAFAGCSSLTNVTIGNGVESIGDEEFSMCTNLTSVTIGNGLTSIGGVFAFEMCNNLTTVNYVLQPGESGPDGLARVKTLMTGKGIDLSQITTWTPIPTP